MKRYFTAIVFSVFSIYTFAQEKIDRKKVVDRHTILITQNNPKKPMQVGNGEFAFNVDITGLQTFDAHNTMSHWSWHSMPKSKDMKVEDFKGKSILINGRYVNLDIDNEEQKDLSNWLTANPHPANLGRIGLDLRFRNGHPASLSDIKNTTQKLDLWTGIITSSFTFDNEQVIIKTACHPTQDAIGIEINSVLIEKRQLSILVDFPYADDRYGSDFVGDYANDDKHKTKVKNSSNCLALLREMDDLKYSLLIKSTKQIKLKNNDNVKDPHKFFIVPDENNSVYSFHFRKDSGTEPTQDDIFKSSMKGWAQYWNSGAAIDFSGSTDERAMELERRVVLSQYLMKVNNTGTLPSPESGLLKNNWYGKFHFEMIWWHEAHFAFWNRYNEAEKLLQVYQKFLPTSMERAKKQGYKGSRWPKATGNIDREWPNMLHPLLIWQQPHPIYFAELDYRNHSTQQTLEKWKDVVFATADFMASYPILDPGSGRYNLEPPIFTASENTNGDSTKNPTFELSYWRYGLKTAIEWRKRMKLPDQPIWNDVLKNLAPLPIQDSLYVTYEGIKNMWTSYNYEHPCLVATYGMLPGVGVDTATLHRTFNKVIKTWDFDRTWGWDYPLLAMTAARLHMPEIAIDMLLHPSEQNSYDTLGYNSWVYLPGNGGLLSAVAMMAGGWDGELDSHAPGFPKNGKWKIKVEGFKKMP